MNKNNNDNLAEIEKMIQSFAKPNIDNDRKESIRKNIFNSLESSQVEGEFSKDFSAVREDVNIDNSKRAHLREKLIEKFEKDKAPKFSWKLIISFPFAVLILCFGFYIVNNFDEESNFKNNDFIEESEHQITENNVSFIAQFEGEVVLKRGNESFVVENGMEVFERDQFEIGSGTLELEFFDGKKVFLKEDSNLKIEDLLDSQEEKLIVLDLAKGNLQFESISYDDSVPMFVNVADYSFVAEENDFSLHFDGKNDFQLEGEKVMIISDEGVDLQSGLIAFEMGNYQFDSSGMDFDFQNFDDDLDLVVKSLDYLNTSDLMSAKSKFDLAEIYFKKNRSTSDRAVALNEFIGYTDNLYKMIEEVRAYDREYAEILQEQIDSTMYVYSEDLEDFFNRHMVSGETNFDAEVLVEGGEIDPEIFDRFINSEFPFN